MDVGEVYDRLGLGHEDLGDPKGGGGVHDRGGEQVAGKEDLALGIGSAQVADVGGEHGSGEGGHSADHQGHELRAGHGGDVRFYQQRSLSLAHKYVGGGGEGFGSGQFEGALHDPCEGANDAL